MSQNYSNITRIKTTNFITADCFNDVSQNYSNITRIKTNTLELTTAQSIQSQNYSNITRITAPSQPPQREETQREGTQTHDVQQRCDRELPLRGLGGHHSKTTRIKTKLREQQCPAMKLSQNYSNFWHFSRIFAICDFLRNCEIKGQMFGTLAKKM